MIKPKRTTRQQRKEARQQRKEARREEAADRRLLDQERSHLAEERRQQATEARIQALQEAYDAARLADMEAERIERERKAAHYQAFLDQWAEDLLTYGHPGLDDVRGIVMARTLSAYYPLPAGQMYDWYVTWNRGPDGHTAVSDDGTVYFEIVKMEVCYTPAEIQRQRDKAQFRRNAILAGVATWEITSAINRNTRAIQNVQNRNNNW